MKKFWNQTVEIKALIISSSLTILGFLGTLFLFWLQRYDVPLAVLLGGLIVSISWLILFMSKRGGKARIKLDIFAIYLRLGLVAIFAALFAFLQYAYNIVIVSPIFLVVSYLVISLLTLLAFIGKDKNV